MKNGGQAFPVQDMRGDELGMSLRDYFAGQALTLVLVRADFSASESITSKEIAEILATDVYLIADAMLAEREKEKKNGNN